MQAGTLLGMLQAVTEEASRLQAAEHDAARDGQTLLQNAEDLTDGTWRVQARMEEAQRLQPLQASSEQTINRYN